MSTTTEDETTVQMKTAAGESEPVPMSEFNERVDETINRLRQLSFDVGGKQPDTSSIKTSIDLLIPRQLRKGSEVQIAITSADGEVLTTTTGRVIGVAFEDTYKDGFIIGTERIHKVKLG